MAIKMLLTYLHLVPVITTAWDLCCEAMHKQSKVNQPYNYFKENYSSLNKHFQERTGHQDLRVMALITIRICLLRLHHQLLTFTFSESSKLAKKPSWWSNRLSVAMCNKKDYSASGKPPGPTVTIKIYAQQSLS